MIEVTLFENNKGITAFEISGHADSGPYGYDLVCAGVSAVSFGSVNATIAISELNQKLSNRMMADICMYHCRQMQL